MRRRRWTALWRRGVVTPVCGIAVSASGSLLPAQSARTQGSSIPRTLVAVRWDTVFRIGGAAADTTLLSPRIIAAREALYVFDTGDRRLKAFDLRGRRLWTLGGPGQGPGEFENVVDLEVDSLGQIWVSDGALGRLTTVAPTGQRRSQFVVQNSTLRHIVPLRVGVLSTQVLPGRFFTLFDHLGTELRSLSPPTDDVRKANPIARQAFTAIAEDGRTWAAIFPFAAPFFVYKDTEVRCEGRLVEGGPFQVPQSGLRPDIWAVSVALADSTIYVLPRGKSDHAFQVLDEYSLQSCRYRRSLRLPSKAIAIAVARGLVFASHDDPAPGVLVLRPQRTPQ